MQSLWQDSEADQYQNALDLRVYTSRLLGQEPALVLHGGGNTSVKDSVINLFGEPEDILYVKGSGWDLATIEGAGFAPVKMDMLLKMAELDQLSDTDMVKYQRSAMIDPGAPNPSVEAILHAIIPFKFVDHTHTDAVVTLTNTPEGEARIKELYGDRVLVIPYIMPGFVLAKLVYDMTRNLDWKNIEGLVLMNHGLFTFSDDARESYENTIKLVSEAEAFIKDKGGDVDFESQSDSTSLDLKALAQIRKLVSDKKKHPVVAKPHLSDAAITISRKSNVKEITTRGPLTPDHVIRTKRIPVVLTDNAEQELDAYESAYMSYFSDNQQQHTMLNAAPNFAIWQGVGALSFGKTMKEASIIEDITRHTFSSILTAENLGQYQALDAKDIFDVEYWELEQAKLKKSSQSPELQGKVALITNADTEVGQACIDKLCSMGANVVALKDDNSGSQLNSQNNLIVASVNGQQCQSAVTLAVETFGGLDMVICCQDNAFNAKLIEFAAQYLQYGISPAVVTINSAKISVTPESHFTAITCNNAGALTDITTTLAMVLSSTYSGENGATISLG